MASSERSTIMPALRYRDSAAAVEWLCRAFGFEKRLVVPGPEGAVAHAELTLGAGMVMVGSGHDGDAYGRLVRSPLDTGGLATGGLYVVVDDVDAHHDRALAAGAEIVLPLRNQDYGGRDYTCRDPEGHVWTFGTYDPWRAAD
ncbi:MAG: VOC family protein [Planctomyces sp.]|nr:VOC family protein [Planctomyces sp.]